MQETLWEESPVDIEIVYPYQASLWKGAEYLVAADLCLSGYDVSMAAEGLRYDLIVDNGNLYRVQVKSRAQYRETGKNNNKSYLFKQKGGSLLNYVGDVDLFAFVALDKKLVMYIPIESIKYSITIPENRFTEDICSLSREQAFK